MSSSTSTSRSDSSLAQLTKKFVNMIETSPNGIINVKDAADKLSVKKRRLYDVTNVLEGIGLLKRHSKNRFEWTVPTVTGKERTIEHDDESRNQSSSEELTSLLQESEHLEQSIRDAVTTRFNLVEDPMLFLTQEDVQSVYKNATVLVIRAPNGAILEVGDPGEEIPPKYSLTIKNENEISGEIKVSRLMPPSNQEVINHRKCSFFDDPPVAITPSLLLDVPPIKQKEEVATNTEEALRKRPRLAPSVSL
mmetsp:Transcript_6266/g.8006  ORF Transcript_6266/g.8006 Transcript_6266/m.8006 type:complete len:250 (-) Transcript_6266:243-992(-)